VSAAAERELRAKLRKIEALYAGAATEGERLAAGAAIERIMARLHAAARTAPAVDLQFTLDNGWSRRLFIALCRRYGLRPYRLKRQRHTTVMVKAPAPFVEAVLWPEFVAINDVLVDYLDRMTDDIIRQEVHGDLGAAPEVGPQ
jgi:hypothetical protein